MTRGAIPPLVTVITPTYDHHAFIKPCISSVVAQTYTEWEQVIIDDGSTDGIEDLINAVRDQRVRYYRQEHQGIYRLADTYNRALAMARGELIAILEGDDFWPRNKLASLVPAFEDPGVVAAFGTTVVALADGSPTGVRIPAPTFIRRFGAAALFNTPVGAATKAMLSTPGQHVSFPCSVVLRRNALEAIGGFQHVEGLPFVDYPTFLTLSLAGRYFYTPTVMGFWRRHGRSATALKYQDITEIRLLAFMRRFLDRNRARITLTREEEETIASALQDWERRIAVYHGLAALSKGQWAEARDRFRAAHESRQPIFRWAGVIGTVASLLHLKLEWLVSIAGRLFDRQARWTGVQRRFSAASDSHDDSAE